MPGSIPRPANSPILIPILILAGLTASGLAQTSQTLHVEFNLFAGRPRPKAQIADSAQARAILDSLAVRIAQSVPCSEIPDMPSTPEYTAALLQFSIPVAQRRTLIVRDGYIHYDMNLPCYRDPGSNLEKLAVATAFQYPDLNAVGGPKPMAYLSCMVPDSLHAESEPCATGLRPPYRREKLSVDRNHASLFLFSLDGRMRAPQSPLFLIGRPGR